MTDLSGSRVIRAGHRLFPIIEYIAIYYDMSAMAKYGLGLAPRPPMPRETVGFDSNLFPKHVRIRPPYGAYLDALHGKSRSEYEIIFDPKEPSQLGDLHFANARRSKEMSELFFRAALVLFYERHIDWITSHERDLEKRPDIFRFAWLLRSAAAHKGPLNMTDRKRRSFVWHHLKFDHSHATFYVFGGEEEGAKAMSIGDVLIFLCEMSDKLDSLGCPQM